MTVFKHIDCTSSVIEKTTEEETPEIIRMEELQEMNIDDAGYINTMSVPFLAKLHYTWTFY